MYVNGIPMLTSLDKTIRYRAVIPIENRTRDELYAGVDKIFRHYNKANFTVTEINCDQEFRPLMEQVSDDLNIVMNYATTDEHVPEAERNNRTLQECVRATYHNLPYKSMPKIMIRHLTMIAAEQLNMFPAKGGISSHYSPYMILNGKVLDFNKHCLVPFGAYVQANNQPNPTNTNAPRTIDCIYLRPTTNRQGGHELMDLNSGRLITRNSVTELPVTELVIRAVEAMAEAKNMKSLKFTNRHKLSIHPADWLEEVEYEAENENNEAEYDEEADEDFDAEGIEKDNYEEDYDYDDDIEKQISLNVLMIPKLQTSKGLLPKVKNEFTVLSRKTTQLKECRNHPSKLEKLKLLLLTLLQTILIQMIM